MELKVQRDELSNSLKVHDIVFALIEENNANLLVEMMNKVKHDRKFMLKNDILLNSSVELKNTIKNLVKNDDLKNYDLNAKPKHTPEFVKRSFNTLEPVVLKLDGNTFKDLENAIIDTNSAATILSFAKQYDVDDAKFLHKLSTFGEMYERAYRRDVMNDYRYQKDDLQLYM